MSMCFAAWHFRRAENVTIKSSALLKATVSPVHDSKQASVPYQHVVILNHWANFVYYK